MSLSVKFLSLIDDQYKNLSNVERKVAEFLREHPEELLGMSINEISEKTGVCKATVVRFCKGLGYNGLKELKIAMGGTNSATEEETAPVNWRDSSETVIKKSLYQMESNIEVLYSVNAKETAENVAAILASAPSLAIIALGKAAITAQYAESLFTKLGKKVHLHTTPAEITSIKMPSFSTPLLVISDGKENETVIGAFMEMKAKGAYTIVITGDEESILEEEADEIIKTPSHYAFQGDPEAFSSIAQMATINALYVMVSVEMGKRKNSVWNPQVV